MAPSSTTHCFNTNQRLVELTIRSNTNNTLTLVVSSRADVSAFVQREVGRSRLLSGSQVRL